MSRTGKDGQEETVAIDWGMSGIGAVGSEIAPTVGSTVFWFQGVDAAQLPELEETVLDGYLQGLRQAGWRGDPRLAHLGYLCTVALRYGPLIASPEVMAAGMGKERQALMKQRFGWSIEEWADRLAQLRCFVIQRADRARRLMAEL